ncbi:MAG: InlB B-repeat-containing protein [Clostridia bacterium]|nr:InlB B-repeat-containing protein [Clostridia bacterium]
MKKILLFLVCALCMGILCSCDSILSLFGYGNSENDGPQPEFYTVTFDSNGGTSVKSANVKPGKTCDIPYSPLRSGATFAGWYYKGNPWNFNTDKVTSDITLVAKWDYLSYNIEYDLSGGTLPENMPTSYTVNSETIVLSAPIRENCRFAGWYHKGKLVTEIPKGSTGDILLVADFYGPDATVPDSQTAAARTWDNDKNITVRLTADTSDAMTVRLDFTKPWQTVKVEQGGKVEYVDTYAEGDKLMLDIKMTPNSDDAIITPVVMIGDTVLETKYGIYLSDGTKIDKNYYPGFVRKAVTFTIDDGNIKMDKKFLDIVRPAGIIGTFNLINTNAQSAAAYLALYKGYEVANHHQLHCLPWRDGFDFSTIEIKNEIFNSATADTRYMYITKTPGLYYIDYKHFSPSTKSPYWHPIATDETYTEYIDKTKEAIENVFGKGSVVGFAYPHGQLNEYVKKYLKDAGYLYARDTGNLKDKTNFALPEDRFEWTYNADVSCLNEVMEMYDVLDDDGNLKFFSFGVHASDFEGKWYVLQNFASKYGNRPEDFWYASNRDIFEYEDAVNALQITEDAIVNPSDIPVFVTINNVKTIIPANTSYTLK